jgi:hypothetical protein
MPRWVSIGWVFFLTFRDLVLPIVLGRYAEVGVIWNKSGIEVTLRECLPLSWDDNMQKSGLAGV